MNISHLIREQAEIQKNKTAVIHPRVNFWGKITDKKISFCEFEVRSNQISGHLKSLNIQKGDRVLLFIKPKIDFSLITFSLFKIGAIPVFIDPGMGIKNLLNSVEQVKPKFMIGEKIVFIIKKFKKNYFKSLEGAWTPDDITANLSSYSSDYIIEEVQLNDTAAILFTSGGTGVPKGVVTTHGILRAQTKYLKEMFNLTPSDIDLAGFALFALFTLSMGMTSVIPDMNPSKPALANPKKIIPILKKYQVSFAAGSPAIWERVGEFAKNHHISFPVLKFLVMFGAPVRGEIHQLWKVLISNGSTYTPYGATESLPLTLISGREVLDQTWNKTREGAGVCIGSSVGDVKIKIIKIFDTEMTSIKNVECSVNEPGEIIVSGSVVTHEYFEMHQETKKSKIFEDGILWHRMGDMGYLDEKNQLWFLGRKTHRVETEHERLYPIAIEAIVNQLNWVRRSALINDGSPSVVIEPKIKPTYQNILDAKEMLSQNPKTKMIKNIYFKNHFPVDVRHNIKIDRNKLSQEFSGRTV